MLDDQYGLQTEGWAGKVASRGGEAEKVWLKEELEHFEL